MREITQRFEQAPHLLGTFCIPPPQAPRSDIGFLAFNAGTLTRIGPNRINVSICRALAGIGIPGLRFDLSGLGDSMPAPEARAFENQAVADLQSAMDELEHLHGVRRFLILGICSGAEHAFSSALLDSRVRGVALFDPYMYPTWRTHWNRYLSRLGEHGVFRAVGGWIRRRVSKSETAVPPTLWSDRAIPSRAEFARGLVTLLDRKVGVYLMYSGGRPDDYNYAGQFRDAFSRWGIASRVRCDYLPAVNHTIMQVAAQEQVRERITAWAGALRAQP